VRACCSLKFDRSSLEEGLPHARRPVLGYRCPLQQSGRGEVCRPGAWRCWRGGRFFGCGELLGWRGSGRAAMRSFLHLVRWWLMSACDVFRECGRFAVGRLRAQAFGFCAGRVVSVCAFQFAVTFRTSSAFCSFSVCSMSPWCRSGSARRPAMAAQGLQSVHGHLVFIVAAFVSRHHCGL